MNMAQSVVRVVLVHAVQVAMAPIEAAFHADWPAADLVHLLDDSLSPDRAAQPRLTPALHRRIGALADYAASTGAHGVLFTCSAFGPAIEAVARRAAIPVLKPNEAMFDSALRAGGSIGMLATFAPSVASMVEEFETLAAAAGSRAVLRTVVVPAAMDALRSGDADRHNQLLADAAQGLAGCDAVMLAHFSTSRALAAVGHRLNCPVLTAPLSAVKRLRQLLASDGLPEPALPGN
jgi:Asp/Glu/hydantoin racemase